MKERGFHALTQIVCWNWKDKGQIEKLKACSSSLPSIGIEFTHELATIEIRVRYDGARVRVAAEAGDDYCDALFRKRAQSNDYRNAVIYEPGPLARLLYLFSYPLATTTF